VKFCLENINDMEIKNILITLTNSYERKIKIIENIQNLGALETNIFFFFLECLRANRSYGPIYLINVKIKNNI